MHLSQRGKLAVVEVIIRLKGPYCLRPNVVNIKIVGANVMPIEQSSSPSEW